MKLIFSRKIFKFTVMAYLLSGVNFTYAHSMVAQHGTLNFIDKHVFLLLSLPVSVFQEIDDNKDGHISKVEFNTHRKEAGEKVKDNIYLSIKENKLIIEGLLLSPSIAHTKDVKYIDQVTVMGRYTLPDQVSNINFSIKLFSQNEAQQVYELTATNKKKALKDKFQLKPSENIHNLIKFLF